MKNEKFRPNFLDNASAHNLFSSEAAIRKNPEAFRAHARSIIQGLPLATIAFDYYLQLIPDDDKFRKDGITLKEQHEESHMVTMNALLTLHNKWIDPKQYGSIDALYAAIIFHDVSEDYGRLPPNLRFVLQYGLENLDQTTFDFDQAMFDIDQSINIVEILTRDGENDRVSQSNKWFGHPYAYVIKLIDWSHKLQTMASVKHFEKNDREQMQKVIKETGFFFSDQRQGFTAKAVEKYKFLKEVCAPLDSIMGMIYHTLSAYKELPTDETDENDNTFTFNPTESGPFNFKEYLEIARPLLSILPKGNNYIDPLLERIKAEGIKFPIIKEFYDKMAKPSFESPDENDSQILENNNKDSGQKYCPQ